MNHFVYILKCADGTLYTGYATDLDKRLLEHNGNAENKSAGAKYTRGRRPVKIIHFERFKTRSEAMKREFAIKQLRREEKEQLINN